MYGETKLVTFSDNYAFKRIIPTFSEGTYSEIEKYMNKILKPYSINAVNRRYGKSFLFYALILIKDKIIFWNFLLYFVEKGGNVNLEDVSGNTVLNICDDSDDYIDKKRMIEVAGGKLGSRTEDTAREEAAKPTTRGIMSRHFSRKGVACRGFSYEHKELQAVDGFLEEPKSSYSGYSPEVDIVEKLEACRESIGRLFDTDDFVSTLFLIKDDWVITARHSVNYSKLENLTVMFGDGDFDEALAIPVSGVIESGDDLGLDYIILKLSEPVSGIKPVELSPDNKSTSLLFVGYKEDEILYFSAFSKDLGAFEAYKIIGYQATGSCLSGSPYFDLAGRVCGIHSCASTDHKMGIYIKNIIETNSESALVPLMGGEDVSDLPVWRRRSGYFPAFTSAAEESEFDERGPLKLSYEPTTHKFSGVGAPNNQSAKAVKDKIKKRLKQLMTGGKILTEVQKRFLEEPKPSNIDIAHNIAISVIRNALVAKMNTPTSSAEEETEREATEAFADAIASSDDEGGVKERLPNLVKTIRTKQAGGIAEKDADGLIREAREILLLLNKRSKNLMPGHAKVNQHLVKESRDPHLIKTASGHYEETEISQKLAETAIAFFGSSYDPVTRADGWRASSSVDSDNNPIKAYYYPRAAAAASGGGSGSSRGPVAMAAASGGGSGSGRGAAVVAAAAALGGGYASRSTRGIPLAATGSAPASASPMFAARRGGASSRPANGGAGKSS